MAINESNSTDSNPSTKVSKVAKTISKSVKTKGVGNWTTISKYIANRTGKQCRERYFNQLNPIINKQKFTKEEDQIILQSHQQFGNRWSKIKQFLPGRTDNQIKNRFNSFLKRKQIERAQCSGKSIFMMVLLHFKRVDKGSDNILNEIKSLFK